MLTFPNCKINIGLRITEKRSDGFHNLQSCFYPIGWSDVLELIPASEFSFVSSGLDIPGDPARNLCVRAYEFLRADFDLPPVHMHLHKIVPIGAGLGGGSSDAAFALKLLNERFSLGLTVGQLQDYARRLGSDCAFFVENKPAYCIEKGDVFREISLDLSGYFILLIYPNLAISTAEAYAGVRPRHPEVSLLEQLQTPIETWRDWIHNDFEDSLFPVYPVLGEIKQKLYELGALYASMSGSGSTVYGIFQAPVTVSNHLGRYNVWQGKL
ncbi:4-diphosphocytidyl-2C-methyl-D-erythritolkinase [Fibrisoma limi BUZ 3]|uniref:4-diphosphocytidyl-2-C-methyl-D-erythritol kinase n=1 Tax=Fibrisoma limi BUZ 3 TaxID=1185876 RepID=I2GST2_9BACT|nr:4-(cytidine 5'-diphospho)-2-C-methyl-D-erythritol kinase [Fibrisoma limi]CCH56961.1 4-diphosphocytidyl-2C-methyl-D-erythritolkinase [Fibrisoma limi BUZ 3]